MLSKAGIHSSLFLFQSKNGSKCLPKRQNEIHFTPNFNTKNNSKLESTLIPIHIDIDQCDILDPKSTFKHKNQCGGGSAIKKILTALYQVTHLIYIDHIMPYAGSKFYWIICFKLQICSSKISVCSLWMTNGFKLGDGSTFDLLH